MLAVIDKSRLTAFCNRVSKLENVYIVGMRGKNAARVEQLWRIDDPDGEGTWDVLELFRDIEQRLLMDPSTEPTFIRAKGMDAPHEVMDRVRMEPMDERTSDELENASSVGHLSVALGNTMREVLGTTERQLYEAQRELKEYRERCWSLMQKVTQLETLQEVGMRLDQLEADDEPDAADPMAQGWAMLSPMLQLMAAAKGRQQITTSASPAVEPQGEQPATDSDADTDTDVDWNADVANAIVDAVEQMCVERIDLVTDEHMTRLMATPLAGRISTFLGFGG